MTDRTPPLYISTAAVWCVICLQEVQLSEVTAGSRYADGRQAFACNAHIGERLRWAVAWLIFDAEQRRSAGHQVENRGTS